MRIATAGLMLLGMVVPGHAVAQTAALSRVAGSPCPGDVPPLRMGLENMLRVHSGYWAQERAALALDHVEVRDVRVLSGEDDRDACGRLFALVPAEYRGNRDAGPRYELAFYQIEDRYVVAVQAAWPGGRLPVPRMPDRMFSFDLEFNRVGERTWP